nr:hypothetical protein [Kytococcus schroeteri]
MRMPYGRGQICWGRKRTLAAKPGHRDGVEVVAMDGFPPLHR